MQIALCALVAACSSAVTPPSASVPVKPQRIMSTNLCTDLLLLMLVPKERIASITWLAPEAAARLLPGAAEGVATNRATAEEVVMQAPDLILASPWSAGPLRRLAEKVGAPVVKVDAANSFADIRRITRQVGAAVGEPQRAEALVAQMDRTLSNLAATRPAHQVEVVAWNGGDAAPGQGTLADAIIDAAGARNLAARLPGVASESFGLEELLVARPQAILRGEDGFDPPSLRDSSGEHRVVRRAYAGRLIAYPETLHSCGLPQSAEAARDLRTALDRLPRGGVRW